MSFQNINMSSSQRKQVEEKIKNIVTFLEPYAWLLDAYLSDFFVKKYNSHIPKLWWDTLSNLNPPELAALLSNDTWKQSCVWPLSLLSFTASIKLLSLLREPRDDILQQTKLDITKSANDNAKLLESENVSSDTHTNSSKRRNDSKTTIENGQLLSLEHCYRRHVKPKKQHEILQLGKVLNQLCSQCSCDHIVDVGAGQGHLSRLMSYGYGFKVTTIEAADDHAPKADKFDREVKRDMERDQNPKKKQKQKAGSKEANLLLPLEQPVHVVAWIDPKISVTDFLRTIDRSQRQSQHVDDGARHSQTCDVNVNTMCLDTSEKSGCLDRDGVTNIMHTDMRMDHRFDSGDVVNCSIGQPESVQCDSACDMGSVVDKHSVCDKLNSLDNSHNDGHITCDTKSTGKHTTSAQNVTNDLHDHTSSQQSAADVPSSSKYPPFALTGLHACGDLSTTLIRVFVNCPEAQCLASVGCCYMKLSTDDDDVANRSGDSNTDIGYPMSKYASTLIRHGLTYEAREMACHFVDCYHQRLLDNPPNLVTHCYRAALQEVIVDKAPNMKHGCIKLTVKKAEQLPFKEYAEKALKKLKLDTHVTEAQLTRAEGRLEHWREVVAFYTLRLSLAPVVETLILLDRVLFLMENGINCKLVPIFDPTLSPRNYVLLAWKNINS